jgi:hypothetical protein
LTLAVSVQADLLKKLNPVANRVFDWSVMDIPKLCNHRKLNGKTCGSIALKDRRYCFYHQRYFDRDDIPAGRNDYSQPVFEDSRSILLAIHQATRAFLNNFIDQKTFTTLLYSYQVASSLINRRDALAPDEADQMKEQEQQQAEAEEQEKKPSQEGSLVGLFLEKLEELADQADEKEKRIKEEKLREYNGTSHNGESSAREGSTSPILAS